MGKAPPSGNAEAVFVSLAPRLQRYLRLLLGNPDDAEDVLQEIFVKFMGQERPENVEAWLFRASRNEALNLMRGQERRKRREETHAGSSAAGDPADQAQRKECVEKIKKCLDVLPEELREILYLKVVENFSFSELAGFLGVPRSTASVRVQEGLILLNRSFHGS